MSAQARTLAVLSVLLGGAALAADAPRPLPAKLESRAGRLRATLDLSPAFPPELDRQLGNGLTNIIAVHVALLPEEGGEPATIYGREIDILYDVWEETYGVSVKDVESDRPRSEQIVFRDQTRLRAYLSELKQVDLGPVGDISEGRWVIQVRVEVNPISKELLERTREFIANPAAGSRVGGSSRSVLGAMASYLLRNADLGTEVHRFRTSPFTLHEVPVK